jgi:hypothetical protein
VENLPYNSLTLNLQLTAVISKLASFPQVKQFQNLVLSAS